MLLQNAAVPTITVCVQFFVFGFGTKDCHICARSDYVTFCTISATAVREVAVCVAFGAPHFGLPVSTWRLPLVDNVGGVAREGVFSAMGVLFFVGWRRVLHLAVQMCDDFLLYNVMRCCCRCCFSNCLLNWWTLDPFWDSRGFTNVMRPCVIAIVSIAVQL